jgi:uncharacterized glyoxalase superfamily protein PhnB
MQTNRSIPEPTVVPVLIYPDVRAATDWLVEAFGFEERVWIGENHRCQMRVGEHGAVIAADERHGKHAPRDGTTCNVLVRVEDARAHCEHARAHGAEITNEPTDWEYGERQYSAVDPYGHHWVFSQTLADVDPADWGGVLK